MDFIFYLFSVPAFILILIVMLFYDLYSKAKYNREREQMQCRKKEAERQRAEIVRLEKRRREDERKKNLAAFRETVFPLSCKDLEVQKIWSDWESARQNIHDTDVSLLEQCKAVFEVVVLLVDKDRALGVFEEKYQSTLFETSLRKCSCPYFMVHKTPCRHMYRLFLILSGNENPDFRIANVSPDLLKALYSVSIDERLDYISGLEYAYRYGCNYRINQKLEREIKLGLWVQSEPDFEPLLNQLTKDKIMIALTKSGVRGFSKSWTKVRLVDWVITEHKDFLQFMFYDYVHLTLPKAALDWKDGIAFFRDTRPHQYILNWTDALT